MKQYFTHSIFLLLFALVIAGCSTEKNTRVSRAFHNVTSHYNIYFNGEEALKNGERNIDERIENDYTRLLPVYKSSDPSAGQMVKSDMETAVLKSSKLIEIHSITKKPKRQKRRTRRYQEFASQEEFNKWIDDAYLLMGKAYFYEQNYLSAIDNLSYVIRKFPDSDTRHEAAVWLIRAYAEMERFTEASEVIQSIQNDDSFPKRLERSLAIATGDYYIKQEKYNEAIKMLEIAIDKTFFKKNKARLQYIVAQLYAELGMQDQAQLAYRKVQKMNPGYKMAFNAKINAAGVFSGTGDVETIKKELNKMLRDKKNIDFRDQIYYALANIYMKEGNRKEAMDTYAKSVAVSFQNEFQRALSSITLANFYFEDLEYRKAQAYYDSAMIIIDETYPDYDKLQTNYKSLTNLVDQLMTVEREDSLQRIAQMPEMERESLISRLIKEEQEKQRNLENLAMQGAGSSSYYRSNRYRMGMGSSQSGAGWYFYNPQTVSYGKVTFKQQWGQRKLEDDWRRSNKSTLAIEEDELMAEGADTTQVIVEDPLQKEYYTQFLPLTDSLMEISHEKIRDALYNAGKLFKSEFNNYARAAETYEDLIRRYPDNIYLLSCYFDLYDLYELMGNKERSDYYRNIIISQFPNSKYAQFLQNPNFFIELQAHTDTINSLYQKIFKNYKSGYYRGIVPLVSAIKAMEPDSQLVTKIDYMEVVAKGTQSDVHQFETLLKGYVQTYPEAEPTLLAKEILSLIQDSTLADYQKLVEMGYISEEIQNEEVLQQNQLNDEFGGKFSYDDDLLHYFVIVYPRDKKIDLNRLKYDIANYNIDHYTKIDFDIETETLDDKLAFLLVRSLENKEAALIYHGAVIRKASVFQSLKDIDYLNFVISSTNYREVILEKSVADYLKFFVKNYSRFIRSNFVEDENEISPEELMARAKAEDDALKERGSFVVVKTGAEKLFSTQIDTTQNFVIAVKDKGLSLRQVLNGFSQVNRNEFGAWNLATQLKQAGDYQLLVVSGIPTLNESMSYFRKVVLTRTLFKPLGQATYRNFLITDGNLRKMIDENKVDDYMEFFRTYYIQRAGVSAKSAPATPPAQGNAPATANTTSTDAVSEEYNGPYDKDINGEHYFVFVIPRLNIDQPAFISGIEAFNTANYADMGLKTEIQPLDDVRQVVYISGLPDRAMAQAYISKVVNSRNLYTPLRNGNYRNFIITLPNFDIFLKEKNITDYMDFYKRLYLGQ